MIFKKTTLSYSIALSMLAGMSQVSFAETDTTHTVKTTESETGATFTTDRSSYDLDHGKLHVPYLTLSDGSSEYSVDMTFTNQDASGIMNFAMDPATDLHAIHSPHFAYTGSAGPEFWAGLTTEYSACSAGKNQSPIDITTTENISFGMNPIGFTYATSALNILNNGHTIQVNYDEGSSISLNGHSYDLLQFHFHTPSEHNIDGSSKPMEMHLVHSDTDGNLAVVGVLIEEGVENVAIADVVSHIPATETAVATIEGVTVNAESLLPASRLEYRYSGSLTTPPCSEGVQWLVLKDSIQMSTAQLSVFQTALHSNNRPIQSTNARNVVENQ